jgi:hypothetical protein
VKLSSDVIVTSFGPVVLFWIFLCSSFCFLANMTVKVFDCERLFDERSDSEFLIINFLYF